MKRWEFKNTLLRDNGKVIFTELSEEQKKRIPDYIEVLRVAHSSDVPKPSFSDYFCKEAIGPVGGLKLAAGNIEYGVCKALHGEEAAVAAYRSFYRRKDKNEKVVLGMVSGQSGQIPALCGNCRDILLDEFGLDLEIIAGAFDGGLATVISMRDYLFSDFEKFYNSYIGHGLLSYYEEIMAHWETNGINNDVYSGDLYPERKYYAMINTSIGKYFGAFDIMCDYHPIYPLRDAIRQIRRKNTLFSINNVSILFRGLKDGALPHVMYKDRQHLLELNAQAEQFCQAKMDPPVFLFDSRDGQFVSMYKTNVKQWLPFAFVPQAFNNNFKK